MQLKDPPNNLERDPKVNFKAASPILKDTLQQESIQGGNGTSAPT